MSAEFLIILKLIWAGFWSFLSAWWWLFIFYTLFFLNLGERPYSFWKWWFWWRYQNFYLRKQTPKWMEVILPKDIVKPVNAMELVLENMWKGYWEPAYFWEKWWQGDQEYFDFQFELVSDGGKIHFYVRTFLGYKADVLKKAIYSQYPEAEIREVEDYSRAIPADIPNKDWDIRAGDFTFIKPDAWPIKTYTDFEKEPELITEEKKRVDPMAMLLEGMTDLKPGEKLWIQIKPFPIGGKYVKPYVQAAKELKDKFAGRKTGEKPKSWFQSMFDVIDGIVGSFLRGIIVVLDSIIIGKGTEPKEEKEGGSAKIELEAPELRMTPREREICAAIENKVSKSLFVINSIRFIYMAKKEEYYHHRWRLVLDWIGSFSSEDMNGFKTYSHTYTKLVNPPPFNLFDKRRLYARKRRIVRLYQNRYETTYPFGGDWRCGWILLNAEELATIFHFPSRAMSPVPGIARVEAKKAEAPPEIPME